MGNFLAELKRRQMFRVAAAYAVLAWLLLQLVNNVAPVLDLPVWVARAFLLALVIGFPVALFFAWMRELPADAATPQTPTTRLDYVLASALVVVIALVSYQQLAPTTGVRTAQQAGVANGSTSADGISIAVLPFANLSGDTAQEFFSDGMTDEIMTALARVQSLRVVGRESAFQFKGERNDMRAVGQALNAQYLINGSVRKAGDRVRITAQLVQADNGVGVWTNSYDRELKDIFATQEDIAQAIASALRVPLGLQQGDTLVSNRTANEVAYEDYLRAKALIRGRGLEQLTDATKLLEQVIARDAGFARGWGLLAQNYIFIAVNTFDSRSDRPQVLQAGFDKAEKTAREALRLDSRNGDGYLALADIERYRGNWTAAEDLFAQALALTPNDSDVLHRNAIRLSNIGYLKEALSLHQKVQMSEPSLAQASIGVAQDLQDNGQFEASIPILEAVTANSSIMSYARNSALARAYAARGEFSRAADIILAIQRDYDRVPRQTVEDAARLLRSAPVKFASPNTLPELPINLDFVYAYVGAEDRFLTPYERREAISYMTNLGGIWAPEFATVRRTERFKTFVRNAGLVDYWRARGWPDLCRPVGADDFVCE